MERLVRLFSQVWNESEIVAESLVELALLGQWTQSRMLSKPLKFNWKPNWTNESSQNGHWRNAWQFVCIVYLVCAPPLLSATSFSFTFYINFECNDVYRPVLIIYLYAVFSLFDLWNIFIYDLKRERDEKKVRLCFV